MANSMRSAKLPVGYFITEKVKAVARGMRIPGANTVSGLCDDLLLLVNYRHINDRDAALEERFERCSDVCALLGLYEAEMCAVGQEVDNNLLRRLKALPEKGFDFHQLLTNTGIPKGPHLADLKRRLRQMEIEGFLKNDRDARRFFNSLYSADTHMLKEHCSKVIRVLPEIEKNGKLPLELRDEVRWLLFSKPVRLVQLYYETNLLETVISELIEAEHVVSKSDYHFANSFINDALLGLGILAEEVSDPTPVQILSVLLLDIGKAKTRTVNDDGKVVYYNHDRVGAVMAVDVCDRLGVDPTIADDVRFIIQNHNVLINIDGPKRFRKLLKEVDGGLLNDLLLVHRIDQLAKMEIRDGKRLEEGYLDNYREILVHRTTWEKEARQKVEEEMSRTVKPLVDGKDLKEDNRLWGKGLPNGSALGRIKNTIEQLHSRGIIETREQALKVAGNKIVLHHLSTNPASYLEKLREMKILGELLPELDALRSIEQKSRYHKEDAYAHTLAVVESLPDNASNALKLAAVFHDIGKADTQTYSEEDSSFHFYGHDKASIDLFEKICDRYRWSDSCFDKRRVCWLIGNHIRVKLDWAKVKNPNKTIEKMFFNDAFSESDIPESYRQDLLCLWKVDSLGSAGRSGEIVAHDNANLDLCTKLFYSVSLARAEAAAQHELEKEIHSYWNGNMVIQEFNVSGPDIGRLVRLGSEYVCSCLSQGQPINYTDIVDAIRSRWIVSG